jgi:hypothetical protein
MTFSIMVALLCLFAVILLDALEPRLSSPRGTPFAQRIRIHFRRRAWTRWKAKLRAFDVCRARPQSP